jgi:hypothetical protein
VIGDLAGSGDLRLDAQEPIGQADPDVQRPARGIVDRDAPLAVGDAPRGRSERRDVGVGD